MNEIEFYNNLSYSELKDVIRDNLKNMTIQFVEIGFYLKRIRDTEQYKEDGYESI